MATYSSPVGYSCFVPNAASDGSVGDCSKLTNEPEASGGWSRLAQPSLGNGQRGSNDVAVMTTSLTGETYTFVFEGTQGSIVVMNGPGYGSAECSNDGGSTYLPAGITTSTFAIQSICTYTESSASTSTIILKTTGGGPVDLVYFQWTSGVVNSGTYSETPTSMSTLPTNQSTTPPQAKSTNQSTNPPQANSTNTGSESGDGSDDGSDGSGDGSDDGSDDSGDGSGDGSSDDGDNGSGPTSNTPIAGNTGATNNITANLTSNPASNPSAALSPVTSPNPTVAGKTVSTSITKTLLSTATVSGSAVTILKTSTATELPMLTSAVASTVSIFGKYVDVGTVIGVIVGVLLVLLLLGWFCTRTPDDSDEENADGDATEYKSIARPKRVSKRRRQSRGRNVKKRREPEETSLDESELESLSSSGSSSLSESSDEWDLRDRAKA